MDIEETIADDSMQEQGIWIPFRDGADFLIAYADRKKARDKLGRHAMRARRANRGRDLETSQADEAWAEGCVGVVLLNWRGMTSKGQEYPFTRENAINLLKKSAVVRDFLLAEASNITNFQKDGAAKEPEESGPMADVKSGTEVPAGTGVGVIDAG